MPSITLCILIASGYERAEIPRMQSERLDFLLASIRTDRAGSSFPTNTRILVCDDYSHNTWAQEKCSEVCKKYYVDYKVKPAPWTGPCGNYNFAVSQCYTKYIAMLGDDQFCSPGWWDYMTYYIDSNPELNWGMLGWSVVFVEDLVRAKYYANKREFYTGPDKMWVFTSNTLPKDAIDNSWCNWDRPRFRGCCTGTAFVIRKDLWEKFGGFFEQIYQFDEDYGDNVWNVTDSMCIQVPTPPIIHFGGACAWPPEKGPADFRWRKSWEVRPHVPVKFEDRGQEAALRIANTPDILPKTNYRPFIYSPYVKGDLILDLGCGKNKRDPSCIGIDIVGKPLTDADIICNLGFDTLPLQDNSCRLVMAHDLLEHIPHTVWISDMGRMKRLQPTVQLFNEVYRVLRHDGLFETNTPVYPHEGLIQDPTHSSLWSPATFQYFANNYYGFKEGYGHTSNFKIVSEKWDDIHYHVVLRAVKE